MEGVQRRGISAGQSADRLVVVIADRAASQAGQEKGKDEDQGIARDQDQEKADDGQQIEKHQGILDPDQEGDEASEQACNNIARGMGRNQIAPDLVAEAVFRLDHRQYGPDQDRVYSLDQIEKKQVADHVAVIGSK